MRLPSPIIILGLLAASIVPIVARAQSSISPLPSIIMVMAIQEHIQTSATETRKGQFGVTSMAIYSSSIPGATVRLISSSGAGLTMYPDSTGKLFIGSGLSPTGTRFNDEFAGGSYTLSTTNPPALTASHLFILPPLQTPNPTKIINFDELQNSTSDVVTIRWNPLPRGAIDDAVVLSIYDEMGKEVYETTSGQLTNADTEITIRNLPKTGKLEASLTYGPAELALGQSSVGVIYSYGFMLTFPIVRAQPATKTAIVCHPNSQVGIRGQPLTLAVAAEGVGISYQWSLDGKPIPGAVFPTYQIGSMAEANAGTYKVQVKDPLGTTLTSRDANVTLVEKADPCRLMNLSIRTLAGSGENSLILGFITGSDSPTTAQTPVLMRVAGPALAPFGVTGTLPDPQLLVYSGSTVIGQNNDWSEASVYDANQKAFDRCYAFKFVQNSRDAALVTQIRPGAYSMVVSDYLGGTGTGLAEIYDASEGTSFPRLKNVSIRANFSPNSPLIAGFVLDRGATSRSVLIRAIGPSLQKYGVGNPLADAKLTLYRGETPIYENDNWGAGADASMIASASGRVGAFALDPNSKDAVLLVQLPPSAYTVMISSPTSGSGVAMIEVFEIP